MPGGTDPLVIITPRENPREPSPPLTFQGTISPWVYPQVLLPPAPE